jgi:uncharacterized membrane protein YecN with MAPEG domain
VVYLLVTANVVPSSLILFTVMMQASSSETSVVTSATWRHIPEGDIVHSHSRENLKSYKPYVGLKNTFFCDVFTVARMLYVFWATRYKVPEVIYHLTKA